MNKRDMRERFLTFETLNGLILFGWISGLAYVHRIKGLEYTWEYLIYTIEFVGIVWSLRKIFVNRIKQQVTERKLVRDREAANV